MLLPITRIGRKRNLNRTKLTRMSTISRARVRAGRRPISILPHQEVTSGDGFLLGSACTAVIYLNTALTIQFQRNQADIFGNADARAHLATTTVVDSLSPQRSAGRGLGRGAFDLCLPNGSCGTPPLPDPLLHSAEERGLVAMSRCARSQAKNTRLSSSSPRFMRVAPEMIEAARTGGLQKLAE